MEERLESVLNTAMFGQIAHLERRRGRLAEVDLRVRLVGGEHEAVLARERRGLLVEGERGRRAGRVVRVVEPQDRRRAPRCRAARRRGRAGSRCSARSGSRSTSLPANGRAALVDGIGRGGHRHERRPRAPGRGGRCPPWSRASGALGVRVQRRAEAARDPAGDRRAQLRQARRRSGRGRRARSRRPRRARMNAGVSSRGSPMPKSIRSAPAASARRARLLQAHERVRREARRTGFSRTARRPPAPRGRAPARRSPRARRACAPAPGRRGRS